LPLDVINYTWSSTNAISASSYFTVNTADTCGPHLPGIQYPWAANTTNGGTTATVAACQNGVIYTIVYTAVGPGGHSATDQIIEAVGVPLPPPTCTFGANPTRIFVPQHSTLAWACSFANNCSISPTVGVVSPVGGSVLVAPTASTVYTLTCSNGGGSTVLTAPVSVIGSPVIETIP